MDRRSLIALGLTSSAMTVVTESRAETANFIGFEAPEDVDIIRIHSGGPVEIDEELVSFRCLGLEYFDVRLEFFMKQAEIARRPFLDGRIDEQIKSLKEQANALKSVYVRILKDATSRNEEIQITKGSEYNIDNPPPLDFSEIPFSHFETTTKGTTKEMTRTDALAPDHPPVGGISTTSGNSEQYSNTTSLMTNPDYKSSTDLVSARDHALQEYLKAKTHADQAEAQSSDALARIDNVLLQIQKVRKLINFKRDTLVIKAPKKGTFVPHAWANAFLRKGHVVGEFRP